MGNFSGKVGEKGRRIEKPPPMFWQRPPTSHQLGIINKEETSRWPLHLKETGAINVQYIEQMAKGMPRSEDFQKAMEWLHEGVYQRYGKHINKEEIPKAKWSQQQMRAMLGKGKIEPVNIEQVKGYVNCFGVPEAKKKRIRIIVEPMLNKVVEESEIPKLFYPSRMQRRQQILSKRYVALFDFAAYFDQFQLRPAIRNFFVMRTNAFDGNDLWRFKQLPMGARFSPAVAQFATWALVHDLPAETCTMIDNVRIASDDPKKFVRAVRTFIQRCKEANITLNDKEEYDGLSDAQLVEKGRKNFEGPTDFLGEEYRGETVGNTERLRAKLKMAFSNLGTMVTRRQVATIVGLAIYMSHTVGVRLCDHGGLLKASWTGTIFFCWMTD